VNKNKIAGKRILVVDDEASAREGLSELLTAWGHRAETAADGIEALTKVDSFEPHIVVTDLAMPRMDGLELLKAIKSGTRPSTAVILLTAHGSIDAAVQAIREGAYDFLTKPVDIVRLQILVEKLSERLGLEAEVADLRTELQKLRSFENLIGVTQVMKDLFKQIEVVAPSTASVLISGPSGTGKELVARAIHRRSRRDDGPFMAINCSAIPATLLESEIFGHEKGAFTGAYARKQGVFELANGGTLFLDEIAEMPVELQAKFLRVLEDASFRRLGGKDELSVDVRVIAASNKDFKKAITERQFREDLFYRLNVFSMQLPPLRDRGDDIPLLALHFVREFAAKNRKPVESIAPEAMRILQSYTWPGNVRELKNVMERAVIMSEGAVVQAENLPDSLATGPDRPLQITLPVGSTMKAAEKEMIRRTLDFTGNNKTKAAKVLGISLKTLHNKLNEYGLRKTRARRYMPIAERRPHDLGAQ
jgi:DNA-binding NtrC family response regulator